MILIYRVEGGEEQRWEFKLGRLRVMEIEAIEKVTGLAYGSEFREALLKGAIRARRALLWVFLRRAHPTLKFVDVDFADDEVVLEQDRDEWTELRKATVDAPGIDEETREMALAAIDKELESAPDAPGKAPLSSDAAGTASP